MNIATETQSLILSRAARRPGNLALPLPDGLHGAAAKTVVGKMIDRGWIEEVEAIIPRGEPLWRETDDGQGTTLIATEAGLEAIGIEPLVANAVASSRKAKAGTLPVPAGTKQAAVVALLERPEGATIAEIAAATRWQAHTVRGAISGALKKKLGLAVVSDKVEGRGRCYRVITG